MTMEPSLTFLMRLVFKLQSLPVLCAYLILIFMSGFWKRKVAPITNMRPILICHNVACSIASGLCFIGFVTCIWQTGSLYSRQISDTLTWYFALYWKTKILELLDTVFMVLRHKTRQISFIHVYHHSSMLLLSDLGRSFYPWPGIAVFLCLNCFVHVFLYMYYGLTALYPDNRPTWKKQMTQIQICQFLVGLVICIFGYFYHNYCIYSILYGVTMVWLFFTFYYEAYVTKQPARHERKEEQALSKSCRWRVEVK